MLTIKQITENTDAVIRGLEKKRFKDAKEMIEKVLELDSKRRNAQNQLDRNLAEVNSTSKSIGLLMKEGKKEEAEAAKRRVSEIKEICKGLQAEMDQAAEETQALLYTIPNVPYESVPEGAGAEDNVVEKMGGMETELPKNALPHWELAKKYDLIDFDLGVKITGAGFPVYKGQGARLQRALINFFLCQIDTSRNSTRSHLVHILCEQCCTLECKLFLSGCFRDPEARDNNTCGLRISFWIRHWKHTRLPCSWILLHISKPYRCPSTSDAHADVT